MKAIFKRIIQTKKTSVSLCKYILTLKKEKGQLMAGDIGARIGNVFSSSDIGVNTNNYRDLDDKGIRKLSRKIDSVTKSLCKRKGKDFNHWVISAGVGESHEDFGRRFEQATQDLFKKLGGGTFLAVQHIDGGHPHGHIVADNYDAVKSIGSKQGCRRSFKRTKGTCTLTLGELNRMDFTPSFMDARRSKETEVKEKWVAPSSPINDIDVFTQELLRLMKKTSPKNLPKYLKGWEKVVRRGQAVSYKKGTERVNLKKLMQLAKDKPVKAKSSIKDRLAGGIDLGVLDRVKQEKASMAKKRVKRASPKKTRRKKKGAPGGKEI